jgi:hypothetical protein
MLGTIIARPGSVHGESTEQANGDGFIPIISSKRGKG